MSFAENEAAPVVRRGVSVTYRIDFVLRRGRRRRGRLCSCSSAQQDSFGAGAADWPAANAGQDHTRLRHD
jgi:hypothetical protein